MSAVIIHDKVRLAIQEYHSKVESALIEYFKHNPKVSVHDVVLVNGRDISLTMSEKALLEFNMELTVGDEKYGDSDFMQMYLFNKKDLK